MIYIFMLSLVLVVFRIIYNFKHKNAHYIRQYKTNGRPYILCSNHLTIIDPIFMVMPYGYGKKFAVMGKAELFKNPILAWFFSSLGVFPVERGTGDKTAINKAINDIKSGRGMLIFPEGTRGKSNEMLKLKSGIFMIAGETGADIIPCRVIYPNKDNKIHFFQKVRVCYGEPLLAEDLQLTTGSRETIRQSKAKLEESFAQILKDYQENPF